MKSAPKRKSAKRKAAGDEDYAPAAASATPAVASSEASYPKQQSSPFIGVTKYKRTGRYEAHVWNSNTTAPSASGKRGRQLHLGSFSDGDRAAKAYDMAALKLKGFDRATTNFPKDNYHREAFMLENQHLELEEFVLRLRKWAQLSPREESMHRARALETYNHNCGDRPPPFLHSGEGGRGYGLPYGAGPPDGYGVSAHPYHTVTTHQYVSPPPTVEGRLPPVPLTEHAAGPAPPYHNMDKHELYMKQRNSERSAELNLQGSGPPLNSYWLQHRTNVTPLQEGGATNQQLVNYLQGTQSAGNHGHGGEGARGGALPPPPTSPPSHTRDMPSWRDPLEDGPPREGQRGNDSPGERWGPEGGGGQGRPWPIIPPHPHPADALRAALAEDQVYNSRAASFAASAPDLLHVQGQWGSSSQHGSGPGPEDLQRAASIAAPEDTARDVLRSSGAHAAPTPVASIMYRVGSAPDPQPAAGHRLHHSRSGASRYHQAPGTGYPLQHPGPQGHSGWGAPPLGWGPSANIAPSPMERHGHGDSAVEQGAALPQHPAAAAGPGSPPTLGQQQSGAYGGHYPPMAGRDYSGYSAFFGQPPPAPAKQSLHSSPYCQRSAGEQPPRYATTTDADATQAGETYRGRDNQVQQGGLGGTAQPASQLQLEAVPHAQGIQDEHLDVAASYINTKCGDFNN